MYQSLQKTLTKILSRFANIKTYDREEEEEEESGQLDYTQMRSDRSEYTLIVYYKNKYMKKLMY